MGGSIATGTSCPNDSTCSGLFTVKFKSETSCWDSSIVLSTKSSSLRRIVVSYGLDIVVFRRVGEELPEFLFVERLVVRILRRVPLHAQMFHNGIIQRLIAQFLADLDHARDLVRLAFAHEVGDGRREHENLHRSDAALLINAFEQMLGDDPSQ